MEIIATQTSKRTFYIGSDISNFLYFVINLYDTALELFENKNRTGPVRARPSSPAFPGMMMMLLSLSSPIHAKQRSSMFFLYTLITIIILKCDTCKAWPSSKAKQWNLNDILALDRKHQDSNCAAAFVKSAPLQSPGTRRNFTSLMIVSSFLGIANQAKAVVMESPTEQVFTAGQPMGSREAKVRFVLARESLKYLVENYDEICKGGGDNVRRYLGTVGVTSGLYGIYKVLKELRDEAKDMVEFTESENEFDYALRAADTSVYSANFVEYSAAKTKPEKFFEDARIDIERMQFYMDEMAAQLDLT